jgi:hypothetical protein
MSAGAPSDRAAAAVDLFWLPLGAGGHCVRLNGCIYEALAARAQRRAPCDLYHAALEVRVDGRRWVIEMAPMFAGPAQECGVVAEGSVGARWAGRWALFRYGVRRWPDGRIPDVAEAVDSPRRLAGDAASARRLLGLVPSVPTPVWGRDAFAARDMWNSNSVVAWLLLRTGIDAATIAPPAGGRAPGWHAGLVAAQAATKVRA